MNRKNRWIIGALAICFAAAPGFAQRSHSGGGGAVGGAAGGAGGPHGAVMSHGGGEGNSSSMGGATHSSASSPTNVLSHNTKLDSTLTSKLQSKGLLPAGTDLKDACNGFKNLGQCMAAIHVSHNLNVPFGCLKADMTGAAPATGTTCPAGTGSSKMSLGKSIQTLAPHADAKSETKTAQKQSDDDIKEAETETKS